MFGASARTRGAAHNATQLEPFLLEVEIPITVSYDDKNGNRFKIKYLLHYDIYSEKGQMKRVNGIEKVATQ
jgi:hypothetical protein